MYILYIIDYKSGPTQHHMYQPNLNLHATWVNRPPHREFDLRD